MFQFQMTFDVPFCCLAIAECVLCFIETDTTTLSEQHKQEVTTYATQTYDVVPKHIVVWVPKVDEEHPVPSQFTIYLIRDISLALK